MLFNIYDLDGSGSLDYKEFSGCLFGRPSTAASARPATNQATVQNTNSNDPEVLAETLKNKLASRGARGVIGLQRQFKIMDDDNSKSLNEYEFCKALTDYGLGFSKAQ